MTQNSTETMRAENQIMLRAIAQVRHRKRKKRKRKGSSITNGNQNCVGHIKN